MLRLSESQLKKIMPRAPQDRAAAFIANQGQLDQYGITENAKRFAMWIANVAHECGEFNTMTENGNYRMETIRKTWPGRFPTDASAAPFAHNPQKLFNQVYANRMGNGPPSSGDGFKFRGRSEPQLTGKDGYKNIEAITDLPLVAIPDTANEHEWMNVVGGAFWHWKKLNTLADAGNFSAVVSRWNGGHIGMAQRQVYYKRALAVLAEAGHAVPLPKPKPTPAFDAEAAQRKLRELGYPVGNVDGDEGGLMRDALLSFQADNSLPTTGELDAATWRELAIAGPKHIPEARANADAKTLREKGSTTVTLADKIKGWGKWLIGGGTVAYAGDNSSPLETAKDYVDQASWLRYAIEPMQELWAFAWDHKLLLVIAAGAGIYFFANRIIQARVADEQSGAHRGR